MRQIPFILFCIVLFLTCTKASYAGFVIKKYSLIADSASVAPPATSNGSQVINHERISAFKTIKSLVLHPNGNGNMKPQSSSGWEGIVAFVCGILGLFTGFLAIPAIIFGAIGMGSGRPNRGLAIAGFVLGLVTVVIFILALLLVLAIFSWII